MIKILFVCHGNICRSTMAECIMKDLVNKAGVANEWEIDSCATSREEIGNEIYPPARRKLNSVGVPVVPHRARQVTLGDYHHFDLLVIMEEYNRRNLIRVIGSDSEHKVVRLREIAGHNADIADPWYTDDFDTAYDQILEGCEALLRKYS